MKELNKYMIEGRIQDELIQEMNESTTIKISKEENEYMRYKASNLVEGVLKEFEMAVGQVQNQDPFEGVDPRIKKSQALIRLISDNIWKMCDAQRKPFNQDEQLDDEMIKLISSQNEPVLKAAINKLKIIWDSETKKEEEEKEEKEEKEVVGTPEITTFDKIKDIISGMEVVTPQKESLKVREVMGDKVMLEDINGNNKIVEKAILKKWINK